MAAFISFLVLLAIYIPAIWWKSYVLVILWKWFVIPAFGVQPLALGYAAGLMLVINYMTKSYKPPTQSQSPLESTLTSIGVMVFLPLFALGFGWVIKSVFI